MPFVVEEIWVLSGDVASHDVLSEVEPYTPSMWLEGPREVIDRLVDADPERLLEVTGYFRRGVRMLMLSSVEPVKTK